MTIELVLLILVAYLLGSVPAAYLAARWSRSIDIRDYGSGNVGVANLLKFTSKKVAIPVIIFDLFKGIVMVWVTQRAGLGPTGQVMAGLAAVIGHNWPVFLRFSGGRGVLTTLGVVLILPVINNLVPWGILVFMAIAGAGFVVIRQIPLGVVGGIAALPLVSWLSGEPLPFTLGFVVMFLIVAIRRLSAPQTLLTASVSGGELVINRLLFDRDVRDRQAWINRVPMAANQQKKRGED